MERWRGRYPAKKTESTIALALRICDGMLADNVERIVIEQYSLSIALYETGGIVPANAYIAHYWGNKRQFNDAALSFFFKSYLTDRSFEKEMEVLDSLQIHSIPIHIKMSNTQRRLTNIVRKLFPDKIITE